MATIKYKTKSGWVEFKPGKEKYISEIEDKDFEMASSYGDFKTGTAVWELEGKTYNQMFDGILFPTVEPEYENPSISISLNGYSNLQEIGAVAATIDNFNINFNRGTIKINDTFQDYRTGEAIVDDCFMFINNSESNTTWPEKVTSGDTTYTYKLFYLEGPQPTDNKGNNVNYPYPAGSITSNTVTVTGVYPWFATTSGTEVVKQSLKRNNIYTGEFTLQATSMCEQIIETPVEIAELQIKDTSSGNFIPGSTDKYTKTSITKTINDNTVTYYQYKYDTQTYGARGAITLKIKF